MTDLSHILIFRTNIRTSADKQRIHERLNTFGQIVDWHVDTEDVDCVLRIVSHELKAHEIIKLINQTGYSCSELE